jgi:hypothetical protein
MIAPEGMITGLFSLTNLASLTLELRSLTSSLPRNPRSTSTDTNCPSLSLKFRSKALVSSWRDSWPKSMLLHFFKIPVLHPSPHLAKVVHRYSARVKLSSLTQVCGSSLPSRGRVYIRDEQFLPHFHADMEDTQWRDLLHSGTLTESFTSYITSSISISATTVVRSPL